MSDSAKKLLPVEINLPLEVTEKCFVDEFGLKQGSFTRTDSFGRVETGTYQDNLEHGPYQVTENGVVRLEVDFLFGKQHGLLYRYGEDGQLVEKTIYNNGMAHGATRQWNKQGSLTKIGRNDVDAYFTGFRISYHDNQCPKNITFYRKDQEHGLDAWYDERGVLVQLIRYRQGFKIALNDEDRAILNLAKLFINRNPNAAPAYTIETYQQHFAVEAFRQAHPKSTFLEVFQEQTRSQVNPFIQEALNVADMYNPDSACTYEKPKVVAQHNKSSLTLAHSFFSWMPAFARIHD